MMNYSYNQPHPVMEELKRFFRSGSALSVFLLINIGIWILIQAAKVLLFFFIHPENQVLNNYILHNFAVPASLQTLAGKPWTAFTYMFLHLEFWHLLFNMLWLYWFGRIFTEFLSDRNLVAVYLLGGLAGGLVFILSFNMFPVFEEMVPVSFALGASASVMAIVSAISFYVPQYQIQLLFFGRVRILYLAIILFVFDFFMIPSGNAGGHLAHIGGAVFGFLYTQFYRLSRSGTMDPGYQSFRNRFRSRFSGKKSGYYEPGNAGRPVSDEQYNRNKAEQQRRVDEILDKISKGGYDCLTREEKEFLFKSSNRR